MTTSAPNQAREPIAHEGELEEPPPPDRGRRAPERPDALALRQAQQQVGLSRVRQTDDVTELMMDFARAQMEFPVIPKNKLARIEKGATRYEYRYADLADAQRVINPILHRHHLAFMMIPTKGSLIGRLIHGTTGQWLEGDLAIVPPDVRGGVQALGQALTYERRYLFASMLNLCLDEDLDGAPAMPGDYSDNTEPPGPPVAIPSAKELGAAVEKATTPEPCEEALRLSQHPKLRYRAWEKLLVLGENIEAIGALVHRLRADTTIPEAGRSKLIELSQERWDTIQRRAKPEAGSDPDDVARGVGAEQ